MFPRSLEEMTEATHLIAPSAPVGSAETPDGPTVCGLLGRLPGGCRAAESPELGETKPARGCVKRLHAPHRRRGLEGSEGSTSPPAHGQALEYEICKSKATLRTLRTNL